MLPIVYSGGGVVVIDKPPGLASTGRDLDDPDCAQSLLQGQLQTRVWAVHQLDRTTSGLNIFVTRKGLVAPVSTRLAALAGGKRYQAVCHGVIRRARIITAPIGPMRVGGRVVPGTTGAGRAAHSEVYPVSRGEDHTLVEVRLHTGRTHQVRVHLRHIGHPLVGERLHANAPCHLHERPALHAWQLELGPPIGRLTSPLPDDLVALCGRLGITI